MLTLLVTAAPIPQRAPTFVLLVPAPPRGYARLTDPCGAPRACLFSKSDESDCEEVPGAASLQACFEACDEDERCTGIERPADTCYKWLLGACNGSVDDVARLVRPSSCPSLAAWAAPAPAYFSSRRQPFSTAGAV